MGSFRFVVSAVKGEFPAAMQRAQDAIAKAATLAIRDTGALLKTEGRQNIAAAGFGAKWQNTWRVNIYPSSGNSLSPAAYAFHKIPYSGIFERGGQIAGKPFLWIPLPAAPLRIGGRRTTPRIYTQSIGPLHLIKRTGKPPLLAAFVVGNRPTTGRVSVAKLRSGARARRRNDARAAFGRKEQGLVSLPLFVGVPSVNMRARFNLHSVFEKARAGLGAAYLKHFREVK
jgi:hypothetical protein